MKTPRKNVSNTIRRTLKRFCVLAILTMAICHSAKAQNSVLDVGVRLQKDIGLYSENGISINFSDKNLLPDRLYIGFSYFSSRIGTAFNSNAIKQDNFLISPAYYFRHDKLIRPFIRINAGYFDADYGSPIFDVLPRKSLLLSPEGGVSIQSHLPLKISVSFGDNLITSNGVNNVPGTIYPFFYQLTLSWNILKQTK
ncbi:MAG TPA: hypothetical protein VFE53_26470 [Mucilaginibacter sp.]|jgi:hypothetical protein|nr:hypothetical protein [Mucilaginibacter sp.]